MGVFWAVIGALLVIVPLWRICTRIGFNGALSLLALIPWLGIGIVGAVLSFANWPEMPEAVEDL